MASTLISTLYPPVIDTFMPAFVNTTDAKVYFSISPFNNSSDIQRVHVSLQNQLNNENALKRITGILVRPLKYDTSSGLYYVVIPVTEIKGGQFNINQFYKVQIRFDNNTENVPGTGEEESKWNNYFLSNQTKFSEWSNICLLRPISEPNIQLRTFDTEEGDIAFNKGIIPISGQVFFGNNFDDTETLQSFNIEILPHNSLEPVLKTKEIYTGDNINPNGINYKLDLQTLDTDYSNSFNLKINITTKNQYKMSKTYPFTIADYLSDESFLPDISVTVDNEDGIATLHIENPQTVFGTLYVKRASSINDFKEYEDIWVDKIAGPINLEIIDNTIGSLVWYRYSVQLENSRGALTQVFKSEKFLPDFYDAIFSRGDQQLRIQYNYKVSGYKPVVNRAKVDTLGGRYPKFVENAILNYKQFSISGSLSATNDENQKFLRQSQYFGNDFNNFLIYNQEDESHFGYKTDESRNIYLNKEAYERNDFFWEREFREAALAWLNDGEPKLYRSMAEGSMVVMLTDVSLTPNTQTGRRMWDFTATAYEIAKADSLTTLDTLGVYDVHQIPEAERGEGSGDNIDPEYVEVVKVGQLYNYKVTSTRNIITDVIRPAIQEKYGGVLQDKNPDDFYLKNVKIFFHNKPNTYLIDNIGGVESITLVPDPGNPIYNDRRDRMRLGYMFGVSTFASEGNTTIFVNDRGYYQLPNNLDIDNIYFLNTGRNVLDSNGNTIYSIEPDIVTIEYTLVYKEKNNMSTIVSGTSVDRTVLGQEQGTFYPHQYLGEKIRNKYNYVQPDIKNGDEIIAGYVEKMQFWKGIFIEAMPYSVAHIQYQEDKEYKDYVVGETGILYMLRDMKVQDLCFLGRRMTRVDENRKEFLLAQEYFKNTTIYSSLGQISEPELNCVYNIAGQLKIYYQHQWYDFDEDIETKTGIAAVPVDAMINYVGDVLHMTY